MKLKERAAFSPTQVEYFDAVRRRLLDIPFPERQPMLADLISRLDDLPARTNPTRVLGDPEKYASLMREAAGYGPRAPRRFAYIRAWRLRRKILIAVTIVLAVTVLPATVVAARWHARYQPLQASSNGAGTTTRLATGAQFGSPLDPILFKYRNGGHVIVDADLYNPGRVTVTVTGFVVPKSPYGPIVPSQLRITRDPSNFAEWQKATPVRRITVHPGERIQLFVVMNMVPWEIPVDGYAWQALPTLTVEVMGVHHLLPIDGQGVGVVGPS